MAAAAETAAATAGARAAAGATDTHREHQAGVEAMATLAAVFRWALVAGTLPLA
jgi:hypothetical protein